LQQGAVSSALHLLSQVACWQLVALSDYWQAECLYFCLLSCGLLRCLSQQPALSCWAKLYSSALSTEGRMCCLVGCRVS